MDTHDSFPFLKEIILFLALSGVLMPLLSRLKINPVLGFLSVGVLLGPYGLASLAKAWPPLSWLTFARPDQVEFLAELGRGAAEPVSTVVSWSEATGPMGFALDAATRVTFLGDRYLHAWVSHQFGGRAGAAASLVARARQFSSFVLLVGRIASATAGPARCGWPCTTSLARIGANQASASTVAGPGAIESAWRARSMAPGRTETRRATRGRLLRRRLLRRPPRLLRSP